MRIWVWPEDQCEYLHLGLELSAGTGMKHQMIMYVLPPLSHVGERENESLFGFANGFQEDYSVLQTTFQQRDRLHGTSWRLLTGRDRRRWNMGTGQWLTSQKYFREIPQAENIAIEKRVTGEQEKGRYQWALGKKYKNSDFWAGILRPLLSQLAFWSCSVLLGLSLVLLAEFTHSCINAPAVVNRDMRSLRRPRENLAHGFVCSSIYFQSDMTISL